MNKNENVSLQVIYGLRLRYLREKEHKTFYYIMYNNEGITATVLSRYENGKKNITAQKLEQLLAIYEISREEFFGPDLFINQKP